MFRDSEQAYKGFTLDTYEGNNVWICSWWNQMRPDESGRAEARKRKDAIAEAKRQIDERG